MKYFQPEHYRSVILGTLVALIALSYYFFDTKAALWCRQALKPEHHEFFTLITKLGDSTYYIAGSLLSWIIFRYLRKNKLWESRAKLFLMALLLSGLIAGILKVIAGRYRPSEWFESQLYGFNHFELERVMHSFPSSHTTTIFAVAMSLYYLWPKSGYIV